MLVDSPVVVREDRIFRFVAEDEDGGGFVAAFVVGREASDGVA